MRRALLLSTLLAAACGLTPPAETSSSSGTTGAHNCVPGQSVLCAGPGGCSGFQSCKADGSGYSACDCSNTSSTEASSSSSSGTSAPSSSNGASTGSTSAGTSATTGSVSTTGATGSTGSSATTGSTSSSGTSTTGSSGSSGAGCASDTECQQSHGGSPAWFCAPTLADGGGPFTCQLGCVADALCRTPQAGCCDLTAGLTCDPNTHACVDKCPTFDCNTCFTQGESCDRGSCQCVIVVGTTGGGTTGSTATVDCPPLPDGGARPITDNSGCDFWGAVLSNSGLNQAFTDSGDGGSEFAIVVTNPDATVTAHATVSSNGQTFGTSDVPPGGSVAIHLPWEQICGTGSANFGFHLTTDAPVTAYQFNPLEPFIPAGTSCSSATCVAGADPAGLCINNQCFHGAYSADASMLLPTRALSTSYAVMAANEETLELSGTLSPLPGAMVIVATQDGTQLTIHFAGSALSTSQSASLSACPTGTTKGNLPAAPAMSTATYALNAGDVLHFWNGQTGAAIASAPNGIEGAGGATAYLYADDFTGSLVSSNLPVAVFGGSDCTNEPYDQFACDHIEEQVLPYSAWGKSYVGVKSRTYTGASAAYPDYWRVMSACGANTCPNGTTVTITPAIGPTRSASSCGARCTCNTVGATTTCTLPPVGVNQTAPWIEFQHGSSFVATADQAIAVAQYLVSESEASSNSNNPTATVGDPSLMLMPPMEQWRTAYTVLAPASYAQNYVNLAVENQAATSQVAVDGVPVPAVEWNNVPGSNAYVAVHALDNTGSGVHSIVGSGNTPVGAVIYGFDSYVSYGYTGGSGLQPINTAALAN